MDRLTRRGAMLGLGAAALAAASSQARAAEFPAGAVIRTLFADVSPASLGGGATLFHEHLSMGPDFNDRFRAASAAVLAAQGLPTANAARGPTAPAGADPMRDLGLMTEALRQAGREGVACIVDASLEGTGMDLAFIRAAARASGVTVVKSAGFYTQPFYPKEVLAMSEDQIVRALIRQADSYPAGVFGEIGSWDEMTVTERRVFRAVGRAHGATNLPVFTHTGIPAKAAIEQLDILEDAGVDPRRVAIGHLGGTGDASAYVQKTICRRGAFVGIDRQGGRDPDPAVALVKTLIDAGFVDNILISGDASRGYGRPVTVFAPQLRAAGVSEAVVRRIMVDNPRRFLAFTPKRPRGRTMRG